MTSPELHTTAFVSAAFVAAAFVAAAGVFLYLGWKAVASPQAFLEMSPKMRRVTSDTVDLGHPLLTGLAQVLGVLMLLNGVMFLFFGYVFFSAL